MTSDNKLKVTFYGGAGTVTGANFLVENSNIKFLLDCGLSQGEQVGTRTNWSPFPYDPKEIDFLFISHSHLDHIGLIPRLVREGFRGKIYSTPPTKDISEVMLVDSLGLLEKEAKKEGKPILYSEEDVDMAIKLWETAPYRETFDISDKIKITFRDSGHVLGSAMIEIEHNSKRLLYTGDMGNSPSSLLNDTEAITAAYSLM
ncbi:MAG: MBL fold metallo-hydrolase [bacterium]